MDNKLFSKFSVYDEIGYLMVGAVAILIVAFDTAYLSSIRLPSFALDSLLAWVVIAYFVGHFVQAVANLISDIPIIRAVIPERKSTFSDSDKLILKEVEEYFNAKGATRGELWSLCYMFSCVKDMTGQIQAFNSYYSLYRGWLIIFLIQSLVMLYFTITSFNYYTLLLLLFSLGCFFLFYRRSKRFWTYTRRRVLETWKVAKTLKL